MTEFDSIVIFAEPVSLKRLKEIGAADDTNMVTARAIGFDAAAALIGIGGPKCAR